MSSQINDQQVQIDTLLAPQGLNLGSAPNLDPTLGSLATDLTVPGSLFIGNGSNFLAIPTTTGGAALLESAAVTGITMISGGGNPNFVNCSANFQKITIGTIKMVYFEFVINQTSAAATTPDVWSAGSIVIPVGFRPTAGIVHQFPATTFQGAFTTGESVFIPLDSGSVQLNCTSSIATTNLVAYTYTGCYTVL